MSDTPKRNEAVAITRYDPVNGYDSTMRSCGGLVENDLGVAVRYSDHVAVIDALQGEVSRLRADADRFVWFFLKDRVATDRMVELHIRSINDDNPTVDEWRAAIDEAINLEPPTDGR